MGSSPAEGANLEFDMSDWDFEYPKEIEGAKLVRTCFACPEQYDVFLDEVQIGYLRLRHGTFRAEYPDCGGEVVYMASPEGDGIFCDDERTHFLTEAVQNLLKAHKETISS